MHTEPLPLPDVEFIEFGTDQWKQKLFAAVHNPTLSESHIGQRAVKFDGRNVASLNSQQGVRMTGRDYVVSEYAGAH